MLTSHLQRLTLTILALRGTHRRQPRIGGVFGEGHNTWRYPWAIWGNQHECISSGSWVGSLTESPKQLIWSRTCSLPSPGCYSLRTICPHVMHFTTWYSRWDEKEMGLPGSVSHSWGSQLLNPTLSLFPVGEITSCVSLFGTELCHLGVGVTQVKWLLLCPGWVAQLVRVSYRYAKVAGLIPVRAHMRINHECIWISGTKKSMFLSLPSPSS